MLTTWLIELFLNELGSHTDRGDQRSYKRLQHEFYEFLSQDSLKVTPLWVVVCGVGYKCSLSHSLRIVWILIAKQCMILFQVMVLWMTWFSLLQGWKVGLAALADMVDTTPVWSTPPPLVS